jgi:DNA-binding XRE family transcriptional regulator
MTNASDCHECVRGVPRFLLISPDLLTVPVSPAIVRGMAVDGMTLRLERVRARVTQTRLAQEMALSRQAITKYEHQDRVRPELVRDYRIALLKCSDIQERVA